MTRLTTFSDKQRLALRWWCAGSGHSKRDAIICDGAVRSGKTMCLSLGFVLWATCCFDGAAFGICGRSLQAVRRNLLAPLLQELRGLGFVCRDLSSRGYVELALGRRRNRFYLFGGRDESSAASIQGVTLAGVLLDECALMPRSFVEQALARCSVQGARLWFSCNPEHPQHWFYTEWIRKAEQKNALYLHFTMADNPSLSPAVRRRYERMYSGPFYHRYVLGKWTAAQGLVYPMFCPETHVTDTLPAPMEQFYISCDYGTVNPMSMGLWGLHRGTWYRMREYYHNARQAGVQHTDEEYYTALEELAAGLPVLAVVVDPSAASFIQCVRRHGRFCCVPAANAVATGIRRVGEWLQAGRLRFHTSCVDTVREFGLYRWDTHAGREAPCKENDHAMDDIRYFVSTVAAREVGGFCALPVARDGW